MDAIYGCDGCRTTIGRAGCPTHRDSATFIERHEWSSSQPILTHCQHGLDLRINPRCYLCRPASDEQVTSKWDHATLDAVNTDLLALIADCLVPLAFAASPDGGRRQSRLEVIRSTLDEGAS